MKQPVITSEEYVKAGGLICPYCKSKDIESANKLEADSGGASDESKCNCCGAEWYDYYKLSGFGIIDKT